MAENSENGQPINSHVERIREEVNKLLPDINFDDDEDDDVVSFSRCYIDSTFKCIIKFQFSLALFLI